MLALPDALVLDFVIYNDRVTIPEGDRKELGLAEGIVKKLVDTLNRGEPTLVFTDRYFTGIKLANHLLEEKIFLIGSIMAIRSGGAVSRLPLDKEVKLGDSAYREN